MQNKFCFADHRLIEQGETQLPFSTILNMMHISKVVWETSHNQAKWNYSHALVLTQSLSKVAWFQSWMFAISSFRVAKNSNIVTQPLVLARKFMLRDMTQIYLVTKWHWHFFAAFMLCLNCCVMSMIRLFLTYCPSKHINLTYLSSIYQSGW